MYNFFVTFLIFFLFLGIWSWIYNGVNKGIKQTQMFQNKAPDHLKFIFDENLRDLKGLKVIGWVVFMIAFAGASVLSYIICARI